MSQPAHQSNLDEKGTEVRIYVRHSEEILK